MILTQEQYEVMYGEGKRSGVPEIWKGIFRRWPDKRLPYVFDSSLPTFNISIIESAIARFNSEMNGCFSIV